jgi:hypothetical protein
VLKERKKNVRIKLIIIIISSTSEKIINGATRSDVQKTVNKNIFVNRDEKQLST